MPSTSTSTTPFITFIPAGVAPLKSADPSINQRIASDSHYPAFQDAMAVREEVFVKEQGVPSENELDEDDHRCFHWVVYASVASSCTPPHRQHHHHHPGSGGGGTSTTRIPVGTIRLVPPSHAPHAHHQAQTSPRHHHPDSSPPSSHDKGNFINLGRLATIPAFRGLGIGKLLVETALSWAAEHPEEIMGGSKANKGLSLSGGATDRKVGGTKVGVIESNGSVVTRAAGGDLGALLAVAKGWEGRVLVHSQVAVKRMWEKFGFVHDESLGEWDEEGIMHVGLWKQIQVKKPA